MANVGIETGTGALRSKLGWGLVFIALFGAAIFLAVRVIGVARQQPAAATASEVAVATHCAEFIALARTKYGDDWKFRLDPRDTVCAQQTQQAWELQSHSRRMAVEAPSQPATIPSSAIAPVPANAEATRARHAETYCLNVISLAKAKFGADWNSRVAPNEAVDCAVEIQKALGQ